MSSDAPLHGSAGNCATATMYYGDMCQLTCDDGWELSADELIRICQFNQSLSAFPPSCRGQPIFFIMGCCISVLLCCYVVVCV